MLPTLVFLDVPGGSVCKDSTYNEGHLGSIPGLGRSPGEGKDYLQYSGLENSMDCIVHGVTMSQIQLSESFNICLLNIYYVFGTVDVRFYCF